MMEFKTSIIDRKMPMNGGVEMVSSVEPSVNGATEKLTRGKTLAETLAFEDTELNFSHVEPTAMNRCEMENETIQ